MALLYFYEENPELHVIAAGSLLEFALKDISFPVGRLQMLNMYPMSFEEFLIANGKDLLAEKIMQSGEQLSLNTTQMVNKEMYNYFMVGGMPECASTFTSTGSILEVINIQTEL